MVFLLETEDQRVLGDVWRDVTQAFKVSSVARNPMTYFDVMPLLQVESLLVVTVILMMTSVILW